MNRWKRLMAERPLAMLLWGSFLCKCAVIVLQGPHYTMNSDDTAYVETARIWLRTGMFTYNDPSQPTLFITPGYPAFLAAMMAVFGDGALYGYAVRLFQAAIVTLSFLLLYKIGLRLVGERAALGAVALCAFSPSLWLVANMLLTEALFLPLLLIMAYCAVRLWERPGISWSAALGVAWAAGVYVRPTVALWPGLLYALLLVFRFVHWRRVVLGGMAAGLIVVSAMLPWWVRNYGLAGTFVPLTQASGNPLLLGTFPYIPPSLEEQRTWHTSNDLRTNDRIDKERALERIKTGFRDHPLLYASWYTVGKFAYFWGDVYYWITLADLPLAAAILYHYAIVIPGLIGVWRWRKVRKAWPIWALFGYMSLLHMVYLAHSRYAIPLIPLLTLFSAAVLLGEKPERKEESSHVYA
jgi:4-amino-4-deoxy-L-arabinose transferase-like glycosyltransferase